MELFREDTIYLDFKAQSKHETIVKLVDLLDQAGILNDKNIYQQEILAREEQSTTGIGFGIAIPHAQTTAVKETRVAFAISKNGIDYDSEDKTPVYLIFMIAACNDEVDLHLQMLAQLSRKLIDPVFRNRLMACTTKKTALQILQEIK